MKVEIWSDVVCPFCYIGKRKFEIALKNFSQQEKVEIIWKSFQLDPTTQALPGKSVIEHLAERKGISLSHSEEMHQNVTMAAEEVGLEYNFDRTIIANTFMAHQLTHFASEYGLQNEVEENLFKAYFIEGKNISDIETLVQLATETGLDADETRTVLLNGRFTADVQADIKQASELGIRGVPFFVFDRKFAVSGAQPSEVFIKALNKALEEDKSLEESVGNSCDTDGNCN